MSADLFSRFFDDIDPMMGPFGLLGITPERCTDDQISAALKQRLTVLAQHPQAWSPEADEVRLALHVAAAQLRDPAVRSVLLASWNDPSMSAGPGMMALGASGQPRMPGRTGGEPGAPSARAAAAAASQGVPGLFGEVALQVLVHSGGWNADAKRRLSALAHAHGISPHGLMQALSEVSRRQRVSVRESGGHRKPGSAGENASGEAEALAAAPPAPQRRSITIATMVLLGLTVLMLAALVLIRSGDDREPRTMVVSQGKRAGTPQAPAAPAAPLAEQSAESLRPVPPVLEDVRPSEAMVRPREVTPADPAEEGRRILNQLRAARAILSSDPRAALKEFEAGVSALGVRWMMLGNDVLLAAQDDIANFVVEASRRDRGTGRAALEAVVIPAQRLVDSDRLLGQDPIASAAWSSGMLMRLRRERELPSALGETIGAVLRAIARDERLPGENTLYRGIALGLDGMSDRLQPRTTDPAQSPALVSAWQHWIVAARALSAVDADAGRQSLLRAAERLVIDGPELTLSKPATDVLGLLLGAMNWRDDRQTGERLLAWFDDEAVTVSDLSMVTAWILTNGAIPGVSSEMLLTQNATPSQRILLRNTYASLLGLERSRDPAASGGRWASQAREMLQATGTATDPAEALLRAAAMAKLNEAAAHRWRQDETLSDRAREAGQIERLRQQNRADADSSRGNPGTLTWPGDERDGQWAKRYLASMNSADQRVELLNELRNSGGPFGPADADVLAEAACFGSPMQVRRLAQGIVRDRSDSLIVINGLLEALPRAARQPAVAEMIRSVTEVRLPTTEDPAWRVIARRAVVDRLMVMIASSRDRQSDALALVIEEAYRARVEAFGPPVAARSGSAPGTSPDPLAGRSADADFSVRGSGTDAAPEQVAGLLWDAWAGQARRYAEGQWTFATFDELQRRRAGRASLAEGPIQYFAGEQASVAEVMAYVVAAERNSRARRIVEVLEQMNTDRRNAIHVYQQIEAAERAMLRLWVVRFGEEAQP